MPSSEQATFGFIRRESSPRPIMPQPSRWTVGITSWQRTVVRFVAIGFAAALLGLLPAMASEVAPSAVEPSRIAENAALPDSVGSSGSSLFPLPFVFYQPETRWGGGAGLLHTWRVNADTRPSTNALFLVLTQRRQFSATVAPECFTASNRWHLGGELSWSRFPDLFYGVGNDTRFANEEDYTLEHIRARFSARRKVTGSAYAGGSIAWQDTRARSLDEDGSLVSGVLAGVRGGRLVGAGPVVVLDTRDLDFLPTRGRFLMLSHSRFDAAMGSDFEADRTDFDARQYESVAPGHTVALHLLAARSSGRTPFFLLPALGGNRVLRGIYEGRYRDDTLLAAQCEYRFPIRGRFAGVAFAGLGEVARTPSGLQVDEIHSSAGAGLRFLLSADDGVRIRVDFGMAEGSTGVYFALGEAF